MKKIILYGLILLGNITNLYAQDQATKDKLLKIAKQEFPKNAAKDFTFGVEQGYPYYITLDNEGFYFFIYVNQRFQKMYTTCGIQAPGLLPDFVEKFIEKPVYSKIQKKLLTFKKSLLVGSWSAKLHINDNTAQGLITFGELVEEGKGERPANTNDIGEVFFDLEGNYLGKGSDFDIYKALGVTLDMTQGRDDNEGNHEEGDAPDLSKYEAPFKINTKYYIRNVKTNLYIDVYGNSMEDRGRLVLYKLTNTPNQQFEILSVDATGKYKIQNVQSGKVLSALPEGTYVIQFESDAGERQIFEIEGSALGLKTVKIKFLYSGNYLSYEGSKPTNATNIYEHLPVLDTSQEWELIPVE